MDHTHESASPVPGTWGQHTQRRPNEPRYDFHSRPAGQVRIRSRLLQEIREGCRTSCQWQLSHRKLDEVHRDLMLT